MGAIGEAHISVTADTADVEAKLNALETRVRGLRESIKALASEFESVIPPIAKRID